MKPGCGLLLLVVLALSAGLAAAFGAGPAADDPATTGVRRFRVEVVWCSRPAGGDVAPLTLEALGIAPEDATRPVAERPRAAGWLGAAATSPELFAAIAARPGAEVMFRFETECGAEDDARLVVSRQIPVTVVDIRGDQRIQTTRFEHVGAALQLYRQDDGGYRMEMELSAVSAMIPSVGAQTVTAKSTGTLSIADGTTAIFTFTDRVEGATRGTDTDQVVEYLFLITRLDLGD